MDRVCDKEGGSMHGESRRLLSGWCVEERNSTHVLTYPSKIKILKLNQNLCSFYSKHLHMEDGEIGGFSKMCHLCFSPCGDDS